LRSFDELPGRIFQVTRVMCREFCLTSPFLRFYGNLFFWPFFSPSPSSVVVGLLCLRPLLQTVPALSRVNKFPLLGGVWLAGHITSPKFSFLLTSFVPLPLMNPASLYVPAPPPWAPCHPIRFLTSAGQTPCSPKSARRESD